MAGKVHAKIAIQQIKLHFAGWYLDNVASLRWITPVITEPEPAIHHFKNTRKSGFVCITLLSGLRAIGLRAALVSSSAHSVPLGDIVHHQ